MLSTVLYKVASAALLVGGLATAVVPGKVAPHVLTAAAAANPAVVTVLQLGGALAVALSAALCTATTSVSSSKSTGAGLVLAALLLLLPLREAGAGKALPLQHPAHLFGLAAAFAVIGLIGFLAPAAGKAPAPVAAAARKRD